MSKNVIFECITGSNLYGTNTLTSDKDYQGVFIPDETELLGLKDPCKEWDQSIVLSDTDKTQNIDRKYYSLKRFLNLAMEGQPGQLELLFAPPELTISTSYEWKQIQRHRDLFLTKSCVVPFLGFAVSQMSRAVLRGENLNQLNAIIDWSVNYSGNLTLKDCLVSYAALNMYCLSNSTIQMKVEFNTQGFPLVYVAGRHYDLSIKLKTFINSLISLKEKYGQRTISASEDKYDYKSVLHAYRLLFQATEILTKGTLTLPRPKDEVDFLLQIKSKQLDMDFKTDLEARIEKVKELQKTSILPDKVDYNKINELCIELHCMEVHQHCI